jgi:hypothetical protein
MHSSRFIYVETVAYNVSRACIRMLGSKFNFAFYLRKCTHIHVNVYTGPRLVSYMDANLRYSMRIENLPCVPQACMRLCKAEISINVQINIHMHGHSNTWT